MPALQPCFYAPSHLRASRWPRRATWSTPRTPAPPSSVLHPKDTGGAPPALLNHVSLLHHALTRAPPREAATFST
nr:unnamed protein product [Digitaria exilis]